jgi:hypothetical protein
MVGRISQFIASWFSLSITEERHDDTVKLAMIGYCDQTLGALHSTVLPTHGQAAWLITLERSQK